MAPRRAYARGGRRGAATPSGRRGSPEAADAAASSIVTDPVRTSSAGAEDASTGDGSAAAPRGARNTVSRASAAGRFRPRAVRRDEADRDALARQEQQKALDRAADERRARGRARYRSKRSRGEAMGSRGGFGRGVTTASGPFSGGAAGTSRSVGWRGSSSSGLGGGGGSKSGNGKFVKDESYKYDKRDASHPREARINANKLHTLIPEQELDSGDEAMLEALHHRGSGAFPIGIYRREHKKPAVVVATTAELEAAEHTEGAEESLWVDGDGSLPLGDQPTEHGVWGAKATEEVHIKKEPETEEGTMDIDVESKAPEERRASFLAAQAKKGAQHSTEAQRIRADMKLLASELGAVTITAESDSASDGPMKNKDGRLYLFQFPPLLPPLKQQHAPQQVKHEAGGPDSADVPMWRGSRTPVDLTGGGARGDDEYGGAVDEEDDDDDDQPGGFRSQLLSQGGMIGRLNVRQSGRVELDWGGTALALSPAAGMDFLTTAAIVEEKEGKAEPGSVGGECVGMGKIMGRFVLAPVWQDEEEWNVAPDELVVG